MTRFTPEELYEIFLAVDDDGDFECPVFTAYIGESPAVAKCLNLEEEDRRAMKQSLRLAKKALVQEYVELQDMQTMSAMQSSVGTEPDERAYELTSELCRMMRNFIQ